MKTNLKNIFLAYALTFSVAVFAQDNSSESALVQPTPDQLATVAEKPEIKGALKKPTEEQKASVKFLKPKKAQAHGKPTSTAPTK